MPGQHRPRNHSAVLWGATADTLLPIGQHDAGQIERGDSFAAEFCRFRWFERDDQLADVKGVRVEDSWSERAVCFSVSDTP